MSRSRVNVPPEEIQKAVQIANAAFEELNKIKDSGETRLDLSKSQVFTIQSQYIFSNKNKMKMKRTALK